MPDLSLRDFFAGLAMHAELAEIQKEINEEDFILKAVKSDQTPEQRIAILDQQMAIRAYDIADAMLEVRGHAKT